MMSLDNAILIFVLTLKLDIAKGNGSANNWKNILLSYFKWRGHMIDELTWTITHSIMLNLLSTIRKKSILWEMVIRTRMVNYNTRRNSQPDRKALVDIFQICLFWSWPFLLYHRKTDSPKQSVKHLWDFKKIYLKY